MRRIVKWGGGAVLQLCDIVPRGPNGPAPSRRIARSDDAPYLRKHGSMCKEVLGKRGGRPVIAGESRAAHNRSLGSLSHDYCSRSV